MNENQLNALALTFMSGERLLCGTSLYSSEELGKARAKLPKVSRAFIKVHGVDPSTGLETIGGYTREQIEQDFDFHTKLLPIVLPLMPWILRLFTSERVLLLVLRVLVQVFLSSRQ
jgi:murein tripeptide amidase MpaA